MKKINVIVGKVPEQFYRRQLPRIPLLLIAVVTGAIGLYALVHSLAATPVAHDGSVDLAIASSGAPFSSTSFWNTPLPDDTPVNTNNSSYVSAIANQLCHPTGSLPTDPCNVNTINGTLNTSRWSVPFYVVPADQPRVPITLNPGSVTAASTSLKDMLSQGVPIPANAQPAGGTDAHIAIYQPSTDTLWELWRASTPAQNAPGAGSLPWGSPPAASYGDNQWHAVFGGVMTNASKSDGIFPYPYGGWTTGLSLMGGLIRIEELQAGHIDHVMNIGLANLLAKGVIPANTPSASSGISWPANRSDGTNMDPLAVPEGQRFRLPASLDLNQYNLTPVAKAIAIAAQKYGFVVGQTAGTVGLSLGDPIPYTNAGLADPYKTGGGVGGTGSQGLFDGLSGSRLMQNFPWDKLQALPFDYGKGGTSSSGSTVSTSSSSSADTTPPAIDFSSPYPANKVSGPVPLSVIATDNVGISQVEFYVDGQKIGTDTTKPYTANWDSAGAAAGDHTITAKAYDSGGNVGTTNVTVQLLVNPPIATGVVKEGSVELGLKDLGTPFAPNSFANLPLPKNTPVNPNTDAYINDLRSDLGQQAITLNTNMWSTPLYIVPSNQAYVSVKLYCSDGSAANGKPGFVSNILAGGIPVPASAHAAAGTDESITLYQPSTGKEWELWRLQKDNSGAWEACWGGRIDNVAQSDGTFTFPYGSSASGLTHLGTIPRIEELQAGHVDHAVNLTLPDSGTALTILKASIPPANTPGATKGYSWPANRSDGKSDNPLAIPEGQRFRLPADLDLSQYNLTPMARILAEAAQKYGLVVDDGGGAVGIRLGDPTTYTAAGYANPYVAGPGVGGSGSNGLFAGLPTYQVMKNFPWDKLQALPYNYGQSGTSTPNTSISGVSFTAPADNATVKGIVTATATTDNNSNVSKVELSLDGDLKMTDTQEPYSYSFDSRTLTNGSHTITAKAYDGTGATKTTTITVSVDNTDTAPPSAPTRLRASAINATAVSLNWDASSDPGDPSTGVAKYNVLRDGIVIAQTDTTGYVDGQRLAGAAYNYAVQAVDGAGNVSDDSNISSLTMPESSPLPWAPPSAPAGLSGKAVGPNQVNLSWGASSDESGSGLAGYNIYRDGHKLNDTPIDTTNFGDSTVKEGTAYSYQVQAVDGAGNVSEKTADVRVRTAYVVTTKDEGRGGSGRSISRSSGGKAGKSLPGLGEVKSTVPRLELMVLGQNNQPVADATVGIAGQTTTTDAAGRATFVNVPTGAQTVKTTYKGKQSTATIDVQKGIFSKWPEIFKVSIMRHEGNTIPILVPVIVMVVAEILIIRPWSFRFQTNTGPQIVTLDHPQGPYKKMDEPGTVYQPQNTQKNKE